MPLNLKSTKYENLQKLICFTSLENFYKKLEISMFPMLEKNLIKLS